MIDVEHAVLLDAPYASWATRARSLVVDLLVVSAVWAGVSTMTDLLLTPVHDHFFDGPRLSQSLGVPSGWAGGALVFLYWFVLIGRDGRTFGMTRSRLIVCDERTGARPSWAQSFVRYAFSMFAAFGATQFLASPRLLVMASYVLVDFVFVPLWDRHRRTLHDILAGTVVRELTEHDFSARVTSTAGRRWWWRGVGALVALMLVGGTLSSWHDGQPDPRGPVAVADKVVRNAESYARSQGRLVVTVHDIVYHFAPGGSLLPIGDDGGFSLGPIGPGTVKVTVGNASACIVVSPRVEVAPRVGACTSPAAA